MRYVTALYLGLEEQKTDRKIPVNHVRIEKPAKTFLRGTAAAASKGKTTATNAKIPTATPAPDATRATQPDRRYQTAATRKGNKPALLSRRPPSTGGAYVPLPSVCLEKESGGLYFSLQHPPSFPTPGCRKITRPCFALFHDWSRQLIMHVCLQAFTRISAADTAPVPKEASDAWAMFANGLKTPLRGRR